MRFSKYVSISEQERNATVQSLLAEIEELEEQLEKLAIAYQQLLNKKRQRHKVGFKPKGDEDEK